MRLPKKLVGTMTVVLGLVTLPMLVGCGAQSDAARRLGEPMMTQPVVREALEAREARPQDDPPVTIYGMEWCGPCHQAAEFLASRGVPFIERNLESDPDAQEEMHSKLRSAGLSGGSIPVLDVKGRILVGFSPQALDRALRPL
jgi:glutaredoxin